MHAEPGSKVSKGPALLVQFFGLHDLLVTQLPVIRPSGNAQPFEVVEHGRAVDPELASQLSNRGASQVGPAELGHLIGGQSALDRPDLATLTQLFPALALDQPTNVLFTEATEGRGRV
jgi:hypothetical protein